jgi:hypothetical protein
MTQKDVGVYGLYMTTGVILFTFGVVAVCFAWLAIIASNDQSAIISSIVAMVSGSVGFNHLQKASLAKPSKLRNHKIELLTSRLSNGRDVNIVVEISFEADETVPDPMTRIEAQLFRALNIRLPKLPKLSDDPVDEIEQIFRPIVLSIKSEIGLGELVVRVVDVRMGGDVAAYSKAQGIYFGEERPR